MLLVGNLCGQVQFNAFAADFAGQNLKIGIGLLGIVGQQIAFGQMKKAKVDENFWSADFANRRCSRRRASAAYPEIVVTKAGVLQTAGRPAFDYGESRFFAKRSGCYSLSAASTTISRSPRRLTLTGSSVATAFSKLSSCSVRKPPLTRNSASLGSGRRMTTSW